MFDDLRSQAATPFDDDDQEPTPQPPARTVKSKTATGGLPTASAPALVPAAAPARTRMVNAPARRRRRVPSETPLLGLTAVQRFVVAIMMFMLVAVFGFVALLVAGAIVLPL